MTTPITIYTEMTPNPVTMKFVLNFLLIDEKGTSIEFRTKEKAEISPLAKKLFEFPFVNGVFISSNFVTVTKDVSCEWYEVIPEIKELVKTQLAKGEPLLTGEFIPEEEDVLDYSQTVFERHANKNSKNMKLSGSTRIYSEKTPNPITMKFVLDLLLIEEGGKSIEFRTKEKAAISPLAKKIFEFPFVNGVFIASNFITVTKDESCEWQEVIPEIKELIKTHLAKGEPLLTGEFITEESEEPVNSSGDIEQEIMSILDEYIRPPVEGDGGAIHFKSFENGVVTVTLKGSCHGCPSTNTTLKMGVQNLLREMLPEVKTVITEMV